jgi:dissimilatory sulfite reductase (desulfoviridin) alpha/beta subunit
MITCKHGIYPNLLILAELAHVQCVSTTTCEHTFSVQNLIKTNVRNRLGNKNLEAMLRIALEGPNECVDDIINDVVPL